MIVSEYGGTDRPTCDMMAPQVELQNNQSA